MVTNGALRKNTTEQDRLLLNRVTKMTLPVRGVIADREHTENLVFECHSICRAIAINIPELIVVDGGFTGLCISVDDASQTRSGRMLLAKHSWLVTPDGAIIDPYPVGFMSLCPVLVPKEGIYAPFFANLYLPRKSTTSELSSRKLWRKSVVLAGLMCSS